MLLKVIKVEDASGNEITIRAKRIISVDGKSFENGPDSNNIVDRLVLLEAQVADLTEFRDVLLSHKPEPETPP